MESFGGVRSAELEKGFFEPFSRFFCFYAFVLGDRSRAKQREMINVWLGSTGAGAEIGRAHV